jgi:hypothetical protein
MNIFKEYVFSVVLAIVAIAVGFNLWTAPAYSQSQQIESCVTTLDNQIEAPQLGLNLDTILSGEDVEIFKAYVTKTYGADTSGWDTDEVEFYTEPSGQLVIVVFYKEGCMKGWLRVQNSVYETDKRNGFGKGSDV